MGDIVIILGSASPRRREILTHLGVAHRVAPAAVDEAVHAGEPAAAYLARVVQAKLTAVRAAHGAGPILVADTSVIVDGAILGKPADATEAEAMVTRLSGRTHEVWTRFAIGLAGEAAAHAETVVTGVTFRALESGEARAYAESGEGLDKAGGYAVQGRAARFVSRIDGSYANVVGLPACEVFVALRRLGLAA